MGNGNSKYKEVQFNRFCKTCKHRAKHGSDYPCDKCLEVPMREGTYVPEKWEGINEK